MILSGALQTDGVIEILGVFRINSHHPVAAAIHTPGQFCRFYRLAEGARFLQCLLRKMQWQIVLLDDRKHVHAFGIGRAEQLDNFAFGIVVARLPIPKFDHDFVTNAGGAAHIARWRHIDVLRDARIGRNHEEELPAALQRADDLASRFFQNADNAAGDFAGRAPAVGTRDGVLANENMIAVHGGCGRVVGNADGREFRIVRLYQANSLTIHANAGRHQIGFERKGIPFALLDTRDLPSALQLREHMLELPLFILRQAELPEQFLRIERSVIGPTE